MNEPTYEHLAVSEGAWDILDSYPMSIHSNQQRRAAEAQGARAVCLGDISDLQEWHDGHGLAMPHPDMFPEHGIIVPGLAAGFLYLTDSRLGLIEGLITHPGASVFQRARAVKEVLRVLIKLAGDLGCRSVVGMAGTESTARMAQQLGMKPGAVCTTCSYEFEAQEET